MVEIVRQPTQLRIYRRSDGTVVRRGTTNHAYLTGRSVADQHPTSAITGLDAALAAKAADADLSAHLADTANPHSVEASDIVSGAPSGLFLRDDGTWQEASPSPSVAHDIRIGNAGGTAYENLGVARERLRRWSPFDADSDASAFAETCEWIAAADEAKWTAETGLSLAMGQGQLEITATAGWSNRRGVYQTISFGADFDVTFIPLWGRPEDRHVYNDEMYMAVADGTNAHSVSVWFETANRLQYVRAITGATYGDPGISAGTNAQAPWTAGQDIVLRLSRVSGTLYLAAGILGSGLLNHTSGSRVPTQAEGWYPIASVVTAATMTRLLIGAYAANSGDAFRVGPVRRYA